jgi:hypothetical protein
MSRKLKSTNIWTGNLDFISKSTHNELQSAFLLETLYRNSRNEMRTATTGLCPTVSLSRVNSDEHP